MDANERARQALAWALQWLDNVEAQQGKDALLDAMPNNAPGRDLMRYALSEAGGAALEWTWQPTEGQPWHGYKPTGLEPMPAESDPLPESARFVKDELYLVPGKGQIEIGRLGQPGTVALYLGEIRHLLPALSDLGAALAGVLAGDPEQGKDAPTVGGPHSQPARDQVGEPCPVCGQPIGDGRTCIVRGDQEIIVCSMACAATNTLDALTSWE